MKGASEGVLREVDLELPLERLICFTGRSGSGCREMAIDVLYAESRRRYMLALSPVEREGMGGIGRVAVEEITGLPPAVYIEDRAISFCGKIAAFLQVEGLLVQLMQRQGVIHCLDCGGICRSFTPEEAADLAIERMGGERCLLVAPLVLRRDVGGSGVMRELRQAGFLRIRSGKKVIRLDAEELPIERIESEGTIDVVVDRLVPSQRGRMRLIEGIRSARAIARGRSILSGEGELGELQVNQLLTCDRCGATYEGLSADDFLAAETRRNPLALQVALMGRRWEEIEGMSLAEAGRFLEECGDTEGVADSIRRILQTAVELGVGHLELGRELERTASGEGQRLLLAGFLASGLVGMLYIFDGIGGWAGREEEEVCLQGLRRLVEMGNTVLVLSCAPFLIVGADAVRHFREGNLVADDPRIDGVVKPGVETTDEIEVEEGGWVRLVGTGGDARRAFDVNLPLGSLICLVGPTGSGKSSFLNRVLLPALRGKGGRDVEVEYRGHRGIRRIVELPRRESSRGILLEELGLSEYLGRLYADSPAAHKRGYPPEFFRLDGPGGRCTACEGKGVLHFDMQFLEDISLTCPACGGKRYKEEILDITVRGMNIGEVLELTVDEAAVQFERDRRLTARFEALRRCGLGGRRLGERPERLAREERLRLALAIELVRAGQRDLIAADQPVAGEHPLDVEPLVAGLRGLVRRGATLVLVEPHPLVLEVADCIVEFAPEREISVAMRG